MKPRVCILRTDGTNCDVETAHAFHLAGGEAYAVHMNELRSGDMHLGTFQLLAIPGGFSYGDDVASGKILASELVTFLGDELRQFVSAGKPILGICNGFQVLVRTGLLPFPQLGEMRATLAANVSGHFQCEWVGLKPDPESPCIFTRGLPPLMELQMAHGEGRFYAPPSLLIDASRQKLFALRYASNPNGSVRDIAGVCDPTGRIFGLMPHPERFVDRLHHPNWRRRPADSPPDGLRIFQNAIDYAKQA